MTSQDGLVFSPSKPGLETLSDSSPKPVRPPPLSAASTVHSAGPPLCASSWSSERSLPISLPAPSHLFSPTCALAARSPVHRHSWCLAQGGGPRHLLLWDCDVGAVQTFLSPERWATLAKSLYLSGLCRLLSKMRHRKAIEAGGTTAWTL